VRDAADVAVVAELLGEYRNRAEQRLEEIYGSHGFGRNFQERAMAMYDELRAGIGAGPQAPLEAGEASGLTSLRWFESQRIRVAQIGAELQNARNEFFFAAVPAMLPQALREAAIRSMATFFTGYLRALNQGDAAAIYQLIGTTVRALESAASSDAVARLGVDAALALLKFDVVWCFKRESDRWLPIAVASDPAYAASETPDRTFADGDLGELSALTRGKTVVYPSTDGAPLAAFSLVRSFNMESMLWVPILFEDVCWGALALGRTTMTPIGEQERAIAEILAAQIAANVRARAALDELRTAHDALQQAQIRLRLDLNRQREIANVLQQAFIPKELPTIPDLSFDALYSPAEDDARVGGDWYDVFTLPSGLICFSVGDIAGHGLDAAVTMGLIRQALYASAVDAADPAEVLRKVNRIVDLQQTGLATAIVGFIDSQARTIVYANAGHPPPIMIRNERAEYAAIGGIPLGVLPDFEPAMQRLTYDDRSAFVFYTDGLIEFSRDVAQGQAALLAAVQSLIDGGDWRNAATAIRTKTIESERHRDDVAILVIRTGVMALGGGSSSQALPRFLSWDFDSRDAHTARAARGHMIEHLKEFTEPGSDIATAELILGELLANTVEHAPGRVHVSLDCTGDEPIAFVSDNGRGFKLRAKLPDDPLQEGGRGLYLVSTLAKHLRVRYRLEGGTEITTVLPMECRRS
jgi:serine phosphatase RsbU (regulator of sigma subunit)/anti-sigma regulatory factor (Ser/Thr protein kinase)